jgi:hypothetical protein
MLGFAILLVNRMGAIDVECVSAMISRISDAAFLSRSTARLSFDTSFLQGSMQINALVGDLI